MKIVIVGENFGLGGLQRVSKVVGESISEYHNVYFYSMFNNENYYEIKKNFVNGSFSARKNFYLKVKTKVKKIIINSILKKEFSNIKLRKKHLDKLLEFVITNKIDVVVVTGPLLISCISYIKKNTNVKCIAWIHNNYNTYINNYARGYISEFFDGMKSADATVCLTKDDLKHYSQINPNTFCIYNPITIKNTQYSKLVQKKICFVGRIVFDHKGIDYLLKIAEQLPLGWKIVMAGNGGAIQVKKLLYQIKKFNLEEKVEFRGPLSGEELNKHYLESSIYVMTSRWEGMPLVLAEAMSFGLPIIAYDQSGSSEVLDEGKFGILVENGNIENFVNNLNFLTNDISHRKFYQKLSIQRVKDFDIERITQEWLKIICFVKGSNL